MHSSLFFALGACNIHTGHKMARKRKIIGEGFGKNILDRSSVLRKDVARTGMFLGGTYHTDAVGARAMTMDGELLSTLILT